MTAITGEEGEWTKNGSKKKDEIPDTCQNPDENCQRTPEEIVRYAVARRADSVWEKFYLCPPCAAMFYRGSTAPRNRLEMRKIDDK